MSDDHLIELLEKYRTGRLSDEDRGELERLLLSSPQAREVFWQHARFHSLMGRWGQESWGRKLAEGSVESTDESPAAPPRDDAETPIRSEPQSTDSNDLVSPAGLRLSWPLRLGWIAAAAALILLTVIVYRDWTKPTTLTVAVEQPTTVPAGVAVLASAVEARWGGEAPAVGGVLDAGPLRLTSGVVQIDFYSGARVILQGPAELELKSPMEAYCRAGRLSAHVPPPARGFKINTAGFSVVDLGTEFGLNVPPAGLPEVHVFEGLVEVKPDRRPEPVKLMAGQAARVEKESLRTVEADRHGFITEAELERLASADLQRRRSAWDSAARLLSQDPATLAHYTFGLDVTDRTIANRAVASITPGSSASLVGCTWAAGRWPGQEAIEFRGRADRVRLDVPLQSNATTLLAWVRVDALPRALTSLMTPDGTDEGTLRWEIAKDGSIRLAVARNLGRPQSDWEVVVSGPVLTGERLGQWVMLASSFDGVTIRHYVNGVEVGSGRARCPSPLRIGPAEMGNWRGESQRGLQGRVDEFAVLSRAMSGDELRALFDAGRADGQ